MRVIDNRRGKQDLGQTGQHHYHYNDVVDLSSISGLYLLILVRL